MVHHSRRGTTDLHLAAPEVILMHSSVHRPQPAFQSGSETNIPQGHTRCMYLEDTCTAQIRQELHIFSNQQAQHLCKARSFSRTLSLGERETHVEVHAILYLYIIYSLSLDLGSRQGSEQDHGACCQLPCSTLAARRRAALPRMAVHGLPILHGLQMCQNISSARRDGGSLRVQDSSACQHGCVLLWARH